MNPGSMNAPVGDGMDRRTFLGRAATALAVTSAAAAAEAVATAAAAETVFPPVGRSGARAKVAPPEEATLTELAEALDTGRTTSRALVAACLARIDAIDRSGPAINSIIELNPDALAEAVALDEERATRGRRSRLHGIPIVVKDSIDTAGRMRTSAGSLALADYVAPRDAAVVEKLRAAGCVILGKTNMSEWSNARGNGAIAGWSARGGLTRNPYALDRSAGGSSSGSAAAVAADLVPAALGVETLGSIVSPSAMCGVVGVKPTVGLASRRGIIPVSLTQDTPGPMCRTVRDAAIMLSAIAGPDPRDPATAAAAGHLHDDYTTFLDADGLKGARIGIARNLFGGSFGADRVASRAIALLRAGGAVVVDPVSVEGAEAITAFDGEVIAHELKAGLARYFEEAGSAAPVKSLADLIAFNQRNSDSELKWFGQETFLYAQTRGPLSSAAYTGALQMVQRFARDEGIDATLTNHRLDAIVAPTQSPAWIVDMLLGDNTWSGGFTPAAVAGYPSITVPAGDVSNLPVGLLFMGARWSEPVLFRLAYAFEQIAQARRPPEFVPELRIRP